MAYHELLITIPTAYRDMLIAKLTSQGCLGVIERDDGFIAYFPATTDLSEIRKELSIMQSLLEKTGDRSPLTVDVSIIADQDWNESWKKGFVPVDVGNRFTIIPPWESPRRDRINLVIDPAMAFGTGHHETTRSCLVLMGKYCDRGGKNSFLDLGTGTGILAIAATKLGFRRVVAIDTDLLAVEATRKNAELNHTPDIDVREGSIAATDEQFDFIAANIISGVLVLLAPQIAAHTRPGGRAVLSGILRGQDDEVVDAATQAGFRLIERYPDGKWISLMLER